MLKHLHLSGSLYLWSHTAIPHCYVRLHSLQRIFLCLQGIFHSASQPQSKGHVCIHQNSNCGQKPCVLHCQGCLNLHVNQHTEWILRRECCITLHTSYLCHSWGPVGYSVTKEKMLVASLGCYRLTLCNNYKTEQR